MKSRLLTPLFVVALLGPLAAWSQMSVSITTQPPPLPVYVQPPVPGEGYIWTPGYWAWNRADRDYFWIPGTWVLAPGPGYLWTPGYWGFYGGAYRWNVGYWGSRVGYYGGINYGYGYGGSGFQGGRWDRGAFHYNESVTNVNRTVVHNVYNTRVENNYNVPRVSYNGGPQGVAARPTAADHHVQTGSHIAPLPNQVQHERAAMSAPEQRASTNHGTPPQAHALPETQRVQQAAKPERSAQAQPKPEQRAQPKAEQHAQPQSAQPRPQADHAQPQAKAEPRGQQRQNEER